MPWNLALQIALLPLYLWLLVGKVLPTDALTLFGSVVLYLLAPLAAAFVTRRVLVRVRGHEWTYGSTSMRSTSSSCGARPPDRRHLRLPADARHNDLGRVGLIVLATIAFFVGLFLIGLTVGRVFHLGYADTATLVFTTTARNSESVIGIAAGAFAGHPLVLVAILIGPIIELPALLALSRIGAASATPAPPTSSPARPGRTRSSSPSPPASATRCSPWKHSTRCPRRRS